MVISAAGCSLTPEPQYIDMPVYVPATVEHPEMPPEISLLEVEFAVISNPELLNVIGEVADKSGMSIEQENMLIEAVVTHMFRDNPNAWFALDQQAYENLSENMQEIIRYMRQQRNIIEYYRETYPTKKQEIIQE